MTTSNQSKSKSTTKAKSKVKGPNKVRSSFTKVSSPVRANKNKNKLKIKESSSLLPSKKVFQQHKISKENFQECTQRVSNLEDVVARIDKAAVDSDAKLDSLSDTLFQSLDDLLVNRV